MPWADNLVAEPNPCNVSFPLHLCLFSVVEIPPPIVRSSSSDNRKLFEVLMQSLEILKNDEREDVFDMVLVLQFLAIEDIPVLLFGFLPTTRNQKYQELNTENFIQAVQKFSFGVLHGEDEDRFINIILQNF
jgi:hypothetical protein